LPALGISARVWAFDTFSLLLGEHVTHVLDVCIAHGDECRVPTDHSGKERENYRGKTVRAQERVAVPKL